MWSKNRTAQPAETCLKLLTNFSMFNFKQSKCLIKMAALKPPLLAEATVEEKMPIYTDWPTQSGMPPEQLSLPGQFLSRRWFMLCITIEVELELWSSTNATAVADAKITGERWWRVEKCVFTLFFGWPENREFAERMWFWASYSMSNKLLLVARHILTSGLQKCL